MDLSMYVIAYLEHGFVHVCDSSCRVTSTAPELYPTDGV